MKCTGPFSDQSYSRGFWHHVGSQIQQIPDLTRYYEEAETAVHPLTRTGLTAVGLNSRFIEYFTIPIIILRCLGRLRHNNPKDQRSTRAVMEPIHSYRPILNKI